MNAIKDQRVRPSLNHNVNNAAQIETESLIATVAKPQKPIKLGFVALHEKVLNQSVPFVMALIHDYVKIYQILGQEIAETGKYSRTEIIFVEKAENTMELYATQTFETAISPEYKALTEKSETKEVELL